MKTAAILKLRNQLAELRRVAGDDTTLAQALVLLEVALRPGEKMTHLAETLQTEGTHSLVSRTVDALGDHQGPRLHRVPAKLIERRPFEGDRRAVALHLTPKGEKLMEKLS